MKSSHRFGRRFATVLSAVSLLVIAGGTTQSLGAQADCDCGCPTGYVPLRTDLAFTFDYNEGMCSGNGQEHQMLTFNASAATNYGCANACTHELGTSFMYTDESGNCLLFAPGPGNGTASGGFSAELFGTGQGQYWELKFTSGVFGHGFPVGGRVYHDGTVKSLQTGTEIDATGQITCDSDGTTSVSINYVQDEDDGDLVWNFTFSNSEGKCRLLPQSGSTYKGNCEYDSRPDPDPDPEPDPPIVPDPPERPEPPIPRFPGGGGGGDDDCNSSDDESSSPVSYLTGHKVERTTDLSVRLSGRDFQLTREYTSDPNFYTKDSLGKFYWNNEFTSVTPGPAGAQWAFDVIQYITGDSEDGTSTLYVEGARMRSVSRYTKLDGQSIFYSTSSDNSYIEPDTYSRIPWLDTAGLNDDGDDVLVWRLRAPGSGEKVFMRVDNAASLVADEFERTDLYGLLLYEIDAYGNKFEYIWTTLGTGTVADREIVRLDRIIASSADDVEHALIEFDWHGESGTGLPSASTQNDAAGEWLFGRIDEVRVRRPASGGGWETSPTQRVQYVHFDEINEIEAQSVFGSSLGHPDDELGDTYDAGEGDLCEVIISKKVDEGGDADGMHSKVTQYRYYAANNDYGHDITEVSNNSVVSELDGFVATGVSHQLMAVIYPQQIEYYAARVFNEFGALGSTAADIASALDIQVSEVTDFQTDVYSSSQAFDSMIDAAERLRWVNFQDGVGNYEFSHAILLPNTEWSSLFDLAGKFITYYDSSTDPYGEAHRVRTQLVSSGAGGCGCGGAGSTLGLGLRYDYMYRRYELAPGFTPPVTVNDNFNIVSDGYSCLIAESYIDSDASSLEYVPYRVHCHDYYWPTSYASGTISGDGVVSSRGVRRIARALCTADTDWGSVDHFDPHEDPIDHAASKWATTRVYGQDSVDPEATQFNNYAKLTAVLSMDAVASSGTGYSAVLGAGTSTLAAIAPQSSEAGLVFTYDYTNGYLTKQSVEEGTEQTGSSDVLVELTKGGGNNRPDLTTLQTQDAGDGVVQTSTNVYGYYDSTHTSDPNASIVAWTKSSMTPETAAQNGPASPGSLDYSNWVFFDRAGQLRWTRDAGGTLSYYEYDAHTGQNTKMIRDADPADASIPAGIKINESNFAGITAAGWALPTRTVYDELTDIYVYDSLGREIESTDAAGVKSYIRRVQMDFSSAVDSNYVKWATTSFGLQYGVMNDYGVGIYATLDFPHKLSDGSFNGPVSISWQDAAGMSLRESVFECESAGGSYDPTASVYTIGDEYARSDTELAITGSTVRSRQWNDLSQTVNVVAGSFFTETRYDGLGRTLQIIDPLGGVTQYGTDTVPGYDIMDRTLAIAQGAMDSSGSITVDLVSETFYDSHHSEAQGIGNGLVSVRKAYTGEGTQSRSTKYWYDYRDRLIGKKNPEAPHQVYEYDNVGRQIEQANWTDETDFDEGATGTVPSPSTFADERSTYSKTFYNNRGMQYRQIQAINPEMDPAHLDFPGYLESLTWYDPEGHAVATWNPGGAASKTVYDHLDRPLVSYITDRAGDLAPGAGSYESIFESSGLEVDISDDHVLSQVEYRYILGGNPGAGNADLVTSRMRLHDTSDVGELDGTNSVAMFNVSRFDEASRVTDSLNYGTNDSVSTNQFKSGTTAPTTIDLNRLTSDALISSVLFDEIGRPSITIDPEGKESFRMYDDLSRTFAVIENYQTGFESSISWVPGSKNWSVSWGTSPSPDENRVTTFTYDDNSNVLKQTAHLHDGSVQVTENEYGVTATTGSGVMESRVSSPNILSAIHYPDETTGLANSAAAYTVSFAYNRLGEIRGRTDQNGTQHQFTLDGLGRPLSDKVMSFGTEIDDTVAEITRVFDNHGRATGVYSWDDAGAPVKLNSVEYEYTLLHQIEKIVQDVDGTGSIPAEEVEYEYTSADVSGSAGNYSRLTGIGYPSQAGGATDTLTIHYVDTPSVGGVNDRISRVSGYEAPSWGHTGVDDLVHYAYLGQSTPVNVHYKDISMGLDYTKGHDGAAASGEYPGFDQYGRVVWHAWVHDNYTTGTNPGYPNATPLMARRYAYDKMSNRINDWDGRPGATLDDRDWEYEYDNLDRLKTANRGLRDDFAAPTTLTSIAKNSRQWNLDMLGNWNNVITDDNGDELFDAVTEAESRTFNSANELTDRDGPVGSGITFSPTYDDAGNYRSNGSSGSEELIYTHDAWNRLVKIERKVGGVTSSVLENTFNGLNWRITRKVDLAKGGYDGLDEERRYYYSAGWQMIEEHVDSDLDGSIEYESQQVWGPRYIDDAVAKKINRDNDDDWTESGDSEFFYLTDAMFSVRALLNSAGDMHERIDYTPYGVAMHRYAADINNDGLVDFFDVSKFTDDLDVSTPGDASSGYNPDADFDGDGLLDFFDVSAFLANFGNFGGTGSDVPDGWISNPGFANDSDNSIGYDGYAFDFAGATDSGTSGVYCVRNRVYDPSLGRWLTNDPAGYVDGMSLVEYCSTSPIVKLDYSGLRSVYKYGKNPPYDNNITLGQQSLATFNTGSGLSYWEVRAIEARALTTAIGAGSIFFDMRAAKANLMHFLFGGGKRKNINMNKMIDQSATANFDYVKAVNDVLRAAERMVPDDGNGKDSIVTRFELGLSPGNASGDWLFAIGKYRTWARGEVLNCGDKYEIDWDYHMRDFYDWDPASNAGGGIVTDSEMAALHRSTISGAQEYPIYGKANVQIEWKTGQRFYSGAKIDRNRGRYIWGIDFEPK